MDIQVNPTLYNIHAELNHVSKRGPIGPAN